MRERELVTTYDVEELLSAATNITAEQAQMLLDVMKPPGPSQVGPVTVTTTDGLVVTISPTPGRDWVIWNDERREQEWARVHSKSWPPGEDANTTQHASVDSNGVPIRRGDRVSISGPYPPARDGHKVLATAGDIITLASRAGHPFTQYAADLTVVVDQWDASASM